MLSSQNKTKVANLTNGNIIEVKNLKIMFDEKTENETLVLEDFSYDFQKNKIFFIIGNSGSGKTALVTHFNGLLRSKYGSVRIDNFLITGKKRKISHFAELRKKIGMVFQFPEYQLFKNTVESDIIFGPINLGTPKEEAKVLAKKYLNLMGMDSAFLMSSPFALSGGQKRRVAIAGILAIEPEIIIFDEPTAGLDPAGEKEMMRIIKDMKLDGKTIIVITHQMAQVLEIADEVLVLGNKKLLASGTPYDIFTNKKLLSENSLDTPPIVKFIEELSKKDNKYNALYEKQPRTIEEFCEYVDEINGIGGKEK
ncbi:MAG: ATP-binding cassette domain-containing protein [Mycoplasmataceae bacterium]|jgi:energy-coupling factor transport system ATP-binding protein|nr:ATP-binding cassette domain-containing protein [Mycoplasmataceae bacterium]